MSITTTPSIDVDVLRRAYAARDADALVSLYAPDATVEIADARNRPSRPQRLKGQDEIRSHHAEVFGREMTHALDIVALGSDAFGYSLRCTYPDGSRVLCVTTAELRDSKIVREVGVQAWDE